MKDERFGGMKEELVAGRLRGYRQWVVWAREPGLRSMGHPTFSWQHSELTAECLHQTTPKRLYFGTPMIAHDGPAPDPDCSCGIYGWYRPEDVNWTAASIGWPFVTILGAVEVWGKVLMGSRGFRAQHARILGLYAPSHDAGFEMQTLNAQWAVVPEPDPTGPTGYRYVIQRNEAPSAPYREVMNFIGDKYEVPIHHDLERLCAQFPPDDLSTLIPGLEPSRYDPRQVEQRKSDHQADTLEALRVSSYYFGGGPLSPAADYANYMKNLLRGL